MNRKKNIEMRWSWRLTLTKQAELGSLDLLGDALCVEDSGLWFAMWSSKGNNGRGTNVARIRLNRYKVLQVHILNSCELVVGAESSVFTVQILMRRHWGRQPDILQVVYDGGY